MFSPDRAEMMIAYYDRVAAAVEMDRDHAGYLAEDARECGDHVAAVRMAEVVETLDDLRLMVGALRNRLVDDRYPAA